MFKSIAQKRFFQILALVFTSMPLTANAETVMLGNGTILETLFAVGAAKKPTTCAGKIKNKYVPGRAVNINGSKLFIPLADDLKDLKAKLKSAKNAAAKRKIQKNIDKLNTKIKSENKLCKSGPGGAQPSPAPTSAPGVATPTPKPNITATPKPGNFDSSGNVTAQGKTKFGIPSNLNANRETGRLKYNDTCRGCHETEQTGRAYSYYRTVTQASPMFVTGLSDQDYANITAYLRRFELN